MMKPELKKLLLLNLPYLLFVYLFAKCGQAYRLAAGADASAKLLHLTSGISSAFANPLPSLHPFDLCVGVVGAVAVRLIVYSKGKNAKKYRKGEEYGSARWGTAKDIAPYIDPKFENNILLTQTERLTMTGRPQDPKTARNKNVLVIGGSGSGKTRFYVKPNLMQCFPTSDYPTSFVVTDPNDSVTREAITRKQERAFLNYVRESGCYKKYYDAIYILFKTGLRISEFVGLTLADIDLEHRKINVDHQLQRTMDMRYVIEEPKTSCGKRVIPMTDDVYVCFRRIIENRPRPKNEPMVDGKCGFLFLDQNGNPTVAMHWEHYFNHICTSYNKLYREQLPNITPHVCRHTFCSNMAKSGMNPKTLQYLMGHSDIGVTLNTYTHVQYDDVETEMKRVVNAE